MRHMHAIFTVTIGLVGAGLVSGQDMDVQGDGSSNMIVFQSKNINTSASDKIAIQGVSQPAPYWGIGVKGIGGLTGVGGYVNATSGSGLRVGVEGIAAGGANNVGVWGSASGSGNNFAVMAQASGTNSRAGKFQGDLEVTGTLHNPSDRRLKRNIREIRDCLPLIGRLAPKEYEYRTDEFPGMNLGKGHQMGLVAQDVEAVLPELVSESIGTESLKEKPAGAASVPESYKNVNYMALIPVLVGAIQEQQAQIEALTRKLAQTRK